MSYEVRLLIIAIFFLILGGAISYLYCVAFIIKLKVEIKELKNKLGVYAK